MNYWIMIVVICEFFVVLYLDYGEATGPKKGLSD